MSSSSNTSIAKKARTKAEADFATWLMMAKLGGFDDLPSNAQSFLTNYRTRLETMSLTREAERLSVLRQVETLLCVGLPKRGGDRATRTSSQRRHAPNVHRDLCESLLVPVGHR
jgi:hypothetical protein